MPVTVVRQRCGALPDQADHRRTLVIILMGGNRINHADSESGNRIGYVNADVGYPRTNAGIYVAVDKVRADGIGQQIVGIVKGDDIQTADDPPTRCAATAAGWPS